MPFVWGSGWNSPIYSDIRRILSYPDVRNYVKVELSKIILEHFSQANVVAGVSTGAISIAAIVADTLGLPFVYLRDTPKDHGLENLIEGNLRPGQKVVLVEDIVSTGGSCLKAAEIIQNAACEVEGCVAIFDYEFPVAVKRLREENIDMEAISNYTVMLEAAAEMDYIHPDEVDTLKEWRKDPSNWVPKSSDTSF